MFATNNQNYGRLNDDDAESYCAFIEWDICLLLPSVTKVSFFADNTLVYQRGVRYQMFWYTQRKTHSLRHLNMPVKPCCAGGNLSPPTHNNHLSLVQINEDDRWVRLAVLTEAPRPESSANCRDGPDPAGYSTLVNSVRAGLVQDDLWLIKKDEGFEQRFNLFSLHELQFHVFAPGPETFCEWTTPWSLFF